jgi:hypothetical protein
MAGPSPEWTITMTININEVVKQIVLDELRAKGYAPNPADAVGIATQVAKLLEAEVEKAVAEVKANQSPTFSVPPVEPVKVATEQPSLVSKPPTP